ncbi:MAG TPA: ATP-binding protein [Aliidongia sp.]|uniref:sensor histidine kinase n=1 Tax=Aliidongia sp. TaxID=1914230 RepID=UPI002DDD7DE6|nr:ATP-binding protein [Aliidongia sp.]HEV2673845.1 ATP-binding protein [Aliidongia sp.]
MLAMLALIYWQTVIYGTRQTDETIDAEITGLAEQYRQRGLAGLVAVINERSNPERGSSMLYLLTDQRQHPLAGNLSRWPDLEVQADGWMRFRLSDDGRRDSSPHIAQATSFVLAGGVQLLVGRDLAENTAFRNRIVTALVSSGALMLLLGLVGGIVLSRRALARIETINRTGDLIMAGEFSRRIPLKGSGDEFDRLAQNLNAMLDQIERLMAGMRQVTDNIAHDLRSPLGRLRSRIEMALIEEPSTERYRDVLQQTIGEADQLLATFTALLDIAEAEAGSPRAKLVPLDLAAFARDLADLYEPVAEEKGLALKIETAAQPIEVRGDRHMLSRAVANLVENALKYTPTGGTVRISVTTDGTMARLAVADDGPGIPPDERERVFDRFYRLEASRTTEGNGLGLSLARAVVRLHGGTITLGGNGPGLVATVSLPLAATAEQFERSMPVNNRR